MLSRQQIPQPDLPQRGPEFQHGGGGEAVGWGGQGRQVREGERRLGEEQVTHLGRPHTPGAAREDAPERAQLMTTI